MAPLQRVAPSPAADRPKAPRSSRTKNDYQPVWSSSPPWFGESVDCSRPKKDPTPYSCDLHRCKHYHLWTGTSLSRHGRGDLADDESQGAGGDMHRRTVRDAAFEDLLRQRVLQLALDHPL